MPELFASCIAVLLLDQCSKRMVEAHVAHLPLSWGSVLQFTHISTRRKYYRHDGARVALVLVWIAAAASAVTLQSHDGGSQNPASVLGLGAALGGALGNLIDIVRTGSVTDFIDLGWWPAFNLADAAIVIGLALVFLPQA